MNKNESCLKTYNNSRPDNEAFTHPARTAISGDDNTAGNDNLLKKAGFFMHASRVVAPSSDEAMMTSRGYAFKAFLATAPEDLSADDFAGLRCQAQAFCNVSTCTRFFLSFQPFITVI